MGKLRLVLVPTLLVLLTVPAVAQTPALTLTAGTPSLLIGPNETAEAKWTVRNTGSIAGTVTLRLAPIAGWTAPLQTQDQSFSLAAGASRDVIVKVSPAVAAPLNATLELSGSIAVQGNTGQSNAQPSGIAINFDAPAPPPPPPPPPKDYTWQWIAGIGSLVFLAGYAAQARSASIRPYQNNMRINLGTDGWVLIHVRNRSWLPGRIQLRVRGLEGRYVAAFSSPEVRLAARESLQIPLLVKVPSNATAGEHVTFQIQARPNGFSPWITRRNVSFDTVDVRIGGPIPIPPNA